MARKSDAPKPCICVDCPCDAKTPHPTQVCFTCREGNHHTRRWAR